MFISYSHDSQEHKKWVLELAYRLRNNGIDAILDYLHLGYIILGIQNISNKLMNLKL